MSDIFFELLAQLLYNEQQVTQQRQEYAITQQLSAKQQQLYTYIERLKDAHHKNVDTINKLNLENNTLTRRGNTLTERLGDYQTSCVPSWQYREPLCQRLWERVYDAMNDFHQRGQL